MAGQLRSNETHRVNPLLDHPFFLVSAEIIEPYIFLHLEEIRTWSSDSYKEMLLVLDELKQTLPEYGVTDLLAFTDNTEKQIKFRAMLGFDLVLELEDIVLMHQRCYD